MKKYQALFATIVFGLFTSAVFASEPLSFSELQESDFAYGAPKARITTKAGLSTKAQPILSVKAAGEPASLAPSYYTDKAAFQTAAPNLAIEDFSNSIAGPGSVAGCGNPVTDGNSCFAPGGLLDGLSISSSRGQVVTLGTGSFGNATPMIAADLFKSSTIVEFSHNDVYAVGMTLLINASLEDLQIEIERFDGSVLDVTTTPVGQSLTFWGVVSTSPIGKITLTSPNGNGELIDDIHFGVPTCSVTQYDFEDGLIGPEWTLAGIGHTNQESVEVIDDGGNFELALTADGATAYYGADNAGFLYQELVGNFRVEATLDSSTMDSGKAWRKAGLMARASLDHLDVRLMAMLAPAQERLQFVARPDYGVPGNVKVATEVMGAPSTVRIAIERLGQVLTVQYSFDGGATWITPDTGLGGSIEIDALPETLLVGLSMVSNDVSVTSTGLFDDVSFCQVD